MGDPWWVTALVALSCAWAGYWVGRVRERRRAMELSDRAMRGLFHEARWFTEDPPTANLIMDLANGTDPEIARGRWRRERHGRTVTYREQEA